MYFLMLLVTVINTKKLSHVTSNFILVRLFATSVRVQLGQDTNSSILYLRFDFLFCTHKGKLQKRIKLRHHKDLKTLLLNLVGLRRMSLINKHPNIRSKIFVFHARQSFAEVGMVHYKVHRYRYSVHR